jgi:ribonucleotide monophosphatase NagD (HAD superfamily)
MQGILVRTGKYQKNAVWDASVTPSQIIGSIADLEEIL